MVSFTNQMISQDDIGVPTYSTQIINYISSATEVKLGDVYNYSPINISLGSTCIAEYWRDPTLGSGNYTDNKTDINNNQGIPIIFTISACSGIYSRYDLTTWNFSLNGIEVDTVSRPDMNFVIGGDYTSYSASLATWQGGYWATGEDMKVTFVSSSGINLLLGSAEQVIKSVIWHYDLTGNFNLYLVLNLDISRLNLDFTDPNFILSNSVLNIKMLDKFGVIRAERTYTDVLIDPPNAVGSITTSTSNKTISDITFTMTRDSVRGNSTYTEIHNIKKCVYSLALNKIKEGNPVDYKNNGVSTANFNILNSEMGRGDYCYISYEPKLAGIKPAVAGGIAYTDYITNCRGHKFSIANASLKFKVSGVYGSDILDEITSQNPYIFIDTVNTSGNIQVTFDINHEDWSSGSDRDSLADTSIYPCITTVYLIAMLPNNYEKELAPFKKTYTPYDDVLTYPNVDFSNLYSSILTLDGVYYTTTTLGGTDISLSAQSMEVGILRSGRYKVFVAVVDQFNQVSFWCITNKANNYNIPL